MASQNDFQYPVRVQWEDTDASGVVYHANFIKFMERARSDMIRRLGISQQQMESRDEAVHVVVSLSIAYRRPARLEDELTVRSRLISLRHASCELEQDVLRDEQILTEGVVRVACVNPRTMTPRPFPLVFYNAMLPILSTPLHTSQQARK